MANTKNYSIREKVIDELLRRPGGVTRADRCAAPSAALAPSPRCAAANDNDNENDNWLRMEGIGNKEKRGFRRRLCLQ